MKKLPRGVHRKRRRLLGMKRTKPGEILRPSLLQLDVVADDPDDIRLLLERFFEIVRRSRSHRGGTQLPLVIMSVTGDKGKMQRRACCGKGVEERDLGLAAE
jgi:hypothetical protein